MNLSSEQVALLLDLARSTIRRSLGASNAASQPPPPTDPHLFQPAGCFVSLHELATHRLRGCVGRLDAHEPLYLAVADASRSVLHDPRFGDDPVTLSELGKLELEISLLSPLREAPTPLAFDPMSEGICLTIGSHSGCFLPQVGRETGWSRQHMLERLCIEKLGLPHNAWERREARLQTFAAQILGPEPVEVH